MELGEDHPGYVAAIGQFKGPCRYVAVAYQNLDDYDITLQKKHEEACAALKELAVASEAKVEAAEKARIRAGSRLQEKEATLQATQARLYHANQQNGGGGGSGKKKKKQKKNRGGSDALRCTSLQRRDPHCAFTGDEDDDPEEE